MFCSGYMQATLMVGFAQTLGVLCQIQTLSPPVFRYTEGKVITSFAACHPCLHAGCWFFVSCVCMCVCVWMGGCAYVLNNIPFKIGLTEKQSSPKWKQSTSLECLHPLGNNPSFRPSCIVFTASYHWLQKVPRLQREATGTVYPQSPAFPRGGAVCSTGLQEVLLFFKMVLT